MIYVLTTGSFSDYKIIGVYTDKALAEEFINGNNEINIKEYEPNILHKIQENIPCYGVEINIRTGEITKSQLCHLTVEINSLRDTYIDIPREDYINRYINNPTSYIAIYVRSYISYEHTTKIAIEKRQEWLRTHPHLVKYVSIN